MLCLLLLAYGTGMGPSIQNPLSWATEVPVPAFARSVTEASPMATLLVARRWPSWWASWLLHVTLLALRRCFSTLRILITAGSKPFRLGAVAITGFEMKEVLGDREWVMAYPLQECGSYYCPPKPYLLTNSNILWIFTTILKHEAYVNH